MKSKPFYQPGASLELSKGELIQEIAECQITIYKFHTSTKISVEDKWEEILYTTKRKHDLELQLIEIEAELAERNGS